jgi:hypothetical protein
MIRGEFLRGVAFLISALSSISLLTTPALAQGRTVVGWVENVCIYPGNLLICAKLDTGARSCSLNARHIVEFQRNGKQWVRFNVIGGDGKRVTLEREVHRVARIKRHGLTAQERPVVMLGICLGGLCKDAEVNLVDRGSFLYQMLIGRAFMAGHLIVDPSVKYTTKPLCKEVPDR